MEKYVMLNFKNDTKISWLIDKNTAMLKYIGKTF